MSFSKILAATALAVVVPASAAPSASAANAAANAHAHCYPYNPVSFPTNGAAPNVSRAEWWCPQSMQYGFQGFSYPLEYYDCNDPGNGYDQMNKDFAQMKADFGASLVRMYYPVCTEVKVFHNAMRAARDNGMGLIIQIWTNFGDGDIWKQSQQALYDALDDPAYSAWAPYVIHSADFGSEPVFDGMDGARDQFIVDLVKFRTKIKAKGIPVGISEDWDMPGIMSSEDGTGLGPIGSGVKNNSDHCHLHPMPFYHFNEPATQAWAYIKQRLEWVKRNVGLPTFITETQWAWGPTDHYPDHVDLGLTQYATYWKALDNNCEYFKSANVGWFLHAWRGESTFDIVSPKGGYTIPKWRPRKC